MRNENDLKEKTVFGMFWKFAERISAQLTSAVISILLARLLMPEDYGTVTIVTVLITLCNVLVSNGLGTSLVQKQDTDELDYSTIFYFVLAFSAGIYLLLFACAPLIAGFYGLPLLRPVVRVMGIRVLLAAVNTVQHAYVSKTMQFKRFFWSTLAGTVVSGAVGIGMAYCGFGVWALVFQYLINTTMDTAVLFVTIPWRPKQMFSAERLGRLWGFGWKMVVAALINEVYNSLRTLVIGKEYSTAQLSFYEKADNYPTLISRNIESTLSAVLFPAISTVQDEPGRVKSMLRRSIKTSSYFVLPMLFGLAAVSEDFVRIVLTEKWLPCVSMMKVLCISHCLSPLSSANHQAIKAIGRSDITMKQEIVIKTVGVAIVIVTVSQSLNAVVFGVAGIELWNFAVTIFPNKKLIRYPAMEQLRDVLPNAVIAVVMALAVAALGYLPVSGPALLLIKILFGVLLYAALSLLTKNETFCYLKSELLGAVKKRKAE